MQLLYLIFIISGASEWGKHFPEANGSCQSPVNIASDCACFDPQLTQHPLSVNYTTSRETDILNDGQNVIIYPRYKGGMIIFIPQL